MDKSDIAGIDAARRQRLRDAYLRELAVAVDRWPASHARTYARHYLAKEVARSDRARENSLFPGGRIRR